MHDDFEDTAAMHTRSNDPSGPMVKVTREISVQWLATVVAAIVVSIVANWGALYLAVHDGALRQENSAERQKDYNDKTGEALKELGAKVSKLLDDSSTKRDYDKEQDFKLQELTRRVTVLEASHK